MELVEHFPYDEFRVGQEELLAKLEESWDKFEVFVVRAPVGYGKSPIAAAIQSWELERNNGCCVLTPNNLLRDQYLDDFDWMSTVRSKGDYWIERYNMTELEFRSKIYQYGPKDSEYNRDLKVVKRKTTPVVGNFYTYIAHKLHRQTLIIDEAHSLLGTMQDLAARKLWKFNYKYPNNIVSLADLLKWIPKNTSDIKLNRLRTSIEAINPATLVRMGMEMHRGTLKSCLKLIPLSVADVPSPFWNAKTEKIILMSATIGAKELELMGLANRRTLYVDVDSPIPKERRPVLFQPVADMSYTSQDENIEAMAANIIDIADHYDGKGFVHAPYSLAAKLKPYLEHDARFMFHTSDPKDKKDCYEKFYKLEASSRKIMVGSGMMEGLDLKYGVAEWQAIVKVPYPSLADPAMRHIAKTDSDYYTWIASRDILQASGRVCRSPDDYGDTYLLDTGFANWYEKAKTSLPKWFTETVEGM